MYDPLMLIGHEFTTEPHACAYLPGRQAMLHHAMALALSAEEYEALMDQGYRKFGMGLFRPVCGTCQECRPLRVAVESFRPDRSQRRAWARNQDLAVRVAEPTVDAARLELFRRYHQSQALRKGWSENEVAADEYAMSFAVNPVPSLEVSVWEGHALRAVVITDITPHVVSAIYHFYDPSHARRGLGTFCVLQTLALARRLRKTWVYLGYYVTGCGSLAYKARFKPCEIMDSTGAWRAAPMGAADGRG